MTEQICWQHQTQHGCRDGRCRLKHYTVCREFIERGYCFAKCRDVHVPPPPPPPPPVQFNAWATPAPQPQVRDLDAWGVYLSGLMSSSPAAAAAAANVPPYDPENP